MNQQDIKKILSHPRQLEWACRRGMLELDVLLGNFLREAFPLLPEQEKSYFVQLLDAPDPEIYAWLLGQAVPADADLLLIINKIREHAHARHQA